MSLTAVAGVCALVLAIIHFLVDLLKFSKVPRDKWLSAAGGVSVAYVFVHILPELQEWQAKFADHVSSQFWNFGEHHLYLIALLGLASFYGLERAARVSKQSKRKTKDEGSSALSQIFWIHVLSFAVYNFLIGYLLIHREDNTIYSLLIFSTAMAFHFIVNDFGLLDHYEELYQKKGRWVIAASPLLGWGVGTFTEINDVFIGIMFAFVAGGIILNVLKEELPEDRQSKFSYFILGLIVYSAILLTI